MITIELEPNQLISGKNHILLTARNASQVDCNGLTIRLRSGSNLFIQSGRRLNLGHLFSGECAKEVIKVKTVRAGSAKLEVRCSWYEQNQPRYEDIPFTIEVVDKEEKSFSAETQNDFSSSSGSTSSPEREDIEHRTGPLPRIPFRVEVLQRGPSHMEVRGLKMPQGGHPKATVNLPFSQPELEAILRALDLDGLGLQKLKKEYVLPLENSNLLSGNRLRTDFHKEVGHRLYQAFISPPFFAKFELAKQAKGAISCQLCFDPEDVILAQFPWELIHDGSIHLVPAKGGVELTRFINFPDPPTPLETRLPLKILFISPRPIGDSYLPIDVEKKALLDGLEPLRQTEQLDWETLDQPTWVGLEACLNQESFDIIHFDGHGSYARICPICQTAHYPSNQICVKCQTDMSDVIPEGYLHFEEDNQSLDRVSTADLKMILANAQTRLMVLTACGSGVVQGINAFNGVAPGLIQVGVPAVVGMQGSPSATTAVKFVKRFYECLAKGQPIPEAVNRGRLAIYRDKKPISWYMPVVYLRSSDKTYGQLIKI